MPSFASSRNVPSANGEKSFVPIIFIGAGISSITACGLVRQRYGQSFLNDNVLILEKEKSIGGTWWLNRYPGCGVDTPGPLYGPSWMKNMEFGGGFWPDRDTILEYIERLKDDLRLREGYNLKLGVSVRECKWLEESKKWSIVAEEDGGRAKKWECNMLFINVGGSLTVPKKCEIAGVGKFQGEIWHSARYPKNPPSFEGKNVIVIGNGTSAAQLVPAIAKECKSLTQFIKSKHWVMSRPLPPLFGTESTYKRVAPKLFALFPTLYTIYRGLAFFVHELFFFFITTGIVATWMRKLLEKRDMAFMKRTTPKKYWDLILPEYPLGCRRRILDIGETGYLASLHLPNVHLSNDPIIEILPHSVKTKSGKEYPADIIMLCTGFERSNLTSHVHILGKQGKTLQEYWEDRGGVTAYNTCVVHGFPNLWIGAGPNSLTGHSTAVFNSENITNLAMKIGRGVIEGEHDSVEVRKEAEEEWAKRVREALKGTVFKVSDCGTAWYYDPETGENYTMYPWSQLRQWWRSCFPTWGHWEFTSKASVDDKEVQ